LVIDSKAPTMKVEEYLLRENRFKMLTKSHPEGAKVLWRQAQKDADARWKLYEYLANRPAEPVVQEAPPAAASAPAAAPAAPPAPAPAPEVKK
jgi:hypothetical protein